MPPTSTFVGTYLPVLLGAAAGAIGSFVFVARTKSLSDGEYEQRDDRVSRRQALLWIAGAYTIIAVIGLIVALAVGEILTIVLASILCAVTVGLWLRLGLLR